MAGIVSWFRFLDLMEGLGRIIPKLLLNKAVHRVLLLEVSDRFSMQVMTTKYIRMTWLKKTGYCSDNTFKSVHK